MRNLKHHQIVRNDFGFIIDNKLNYVFNPLREANPGKQITIERLLDIVPDFWDHFLDYIEDRCSDGTRTRDKWLDMDLIWVGKRPSRKKILDGFRELMECPGAGPIPDYMKPPKATTNTWREDIR